MKKQKKSKVIWILLFAVIFLIIFSVIGKKKGWFGDGNVQKVSIEKAEKRTVIETITANGKIQPEMEVKISSDVSGEIVEMQVIEGQAIKKGDLLLKIAPDIYLSGIDRMEASLNQIKANLANSKARMNQVSAQFKSTEQSYNRNKKLWTEKAISDSEYESSLAAFEMGKADVKAAEESVNAAEFTVKSAQASLQEGRDNLAKTTIYSPVDGTVSMLRVEKGERVVGTMQMTGTEMLRIADLNNMEVKVDVNENDIVHVSLFDTAIVEVDAYIDRKFKGIVTEIANSANTDGLTADQVTSFAVKIRILQSSYQDLLNEGGLGYFPFRPGMSATVDIQTDRAVDVLSIPIQAVTTRSPEDTSSSLQHQNRSRNNDETETDEENDEESDQTVEDEEMLEVVFVLEKGKVKIVNVETGIQDNNYIEIKTGINNDMEVVSAPYTAISKRLKNGQKVKVVKKEDLYISEEE